MHGTWQREEGAQGGSSPGRGLQGSWRQVKGQSREVTQNYLRGGGGPRIMVWRNQCQRQKDFAIKHNWSMKEWPIRLKAERIKSRMEWGGRNGPRQAAWNKQGWDSFCLFVTFNAIFQEVRASLKIMPLGWWPSPVLLLYFSATQPLLYSTWAISCLRWCSQRGVQVHHLHVGNYMSRLITHILWHRFSHKSGISSHSQFLFLDPLTSSASLFWGSLVAVCRGLRT